MTHMRHTPGRSVYQSECLSLPFDREIAVTIALLHDARFSLLLISPLHNCVGKRQRGP